MLLPENVSQRKKEAKQDVFRVVEVTEDTIDPVVWGKNFPLQYDGYRRTVDTERTRHGGSDAFEKLDEYSRWREIFKGYAFPIDYREDRGHAYSKRKKKVVIPAKAGIQAFELFHWIPTFVGMTSW